MHWKITSISPMEPLLPYSSLILLNFLLNPSFPQIHLEISPTFLRVGIGCFPELHLRLCH